MDSFDIIKSKFIRSYPNNNEYNDRINRELKLIVEKNFIDLILTLSILGIKKAFFHKKLMWSVRIELLILIS